MRWQRWRERRTKKYRPVALISLVLIATRAGAQPAPDALPPQAELVFEDRFDKPELDAAWKIKVGQWKVVDGALEAKGSDAFLLLNKAAGTSSRLEYTAWSDDPCDLSACLNLDAAASRPAGVFFQFGGMYNKTTAVVYGNARLWEGTAPLIQKGVKYRVVCERWGAFARFFINSQLLFHGVIPEVEKSNREYAGFFIYQSGHIDDVKLYRFRGDPVGTIVDAEPRLQVQTWLSFEEAGGGDGPTLPAGWSINPGHGSARVVLMRDYRNSDPLPCWVDDHCLELAMPKDGKPPRLDGSFPGQDKGLIEFEVLAEPEESSPHTPCAEIGIRSVPSRIDTGFELSLLDPTGQAAVVLATDSQRRFYTRVPEHETQRGGRSPTEPHDGTAGLQVSGETSGRDDGGVGDPRRAPEVTRAEGDQHVPVRSGGRDVLLEPAVAYTGINPKPPLRFAPGRWFRVRVHFDAARGRFTAALVAMYVPERSYNPFPATGHWFVFGKELPFARAADHGQIAGLRLSLAGRGRLRVDNLYVIAPTNGLTVRGKDVRQPARELLGTAERPRHDPLDWLLYSLRETLGTQGQYGEQNDLRSGRHPAVLQAAMAYNELLVEQAFCEVEVRALRRAQHAWRTRGNAPAQATVEVEESAALVAATERELAALYHAYLEAYLDGLNAQRMSDDVIPAAQRLRVRLQETRTRLLRAREQLLGKGDRPNLCAAPSGPFRQIGPVPFSQQVRIDKGRYRTEAGLTFYFPQTNWLFWPEQDRLLQLDGCTTIYGNNFFQGPAGSFINGPGFDTYASWFLRGTPQGKFLIADVVGLHSCYTLTPDWWLAKHAGDDDVFLCDAAGRVPLKGEKRWESDGRAQLNFWNEHVRTAMLTMAGERARYFAMKWPGRVMGWEVLQEAHSGAGFAQTGYNVSAKRAFRERLRKTYGTPETLSKQWSARYQDFDEIEPPAPGASLPSPLNYEFQRFRQESYRDWVAAYAAAVKAELPDVPIVNRIVDIVPYPTDHAWSFDFTVLYPVFDYFEFHTSMGERLRLSDRMMTSLKRVFGGESGIMEWGLGSSGELFDERGARRATEAEFFRLAAGGRSLFNVWYGTNPGWADCANWTDPRWSHTTLRYSTASIPVSITRLRQFERWLLDYPQVEPRVNILESNSSFLNAAPLHGPRSRLVLFAQTLESGGYDYGFLWEDLISAGKQDVKSSELLLLPCATCLDESVQQRLQQWIAAGGRLIAIAPPGLYDPWGRPSGKLLSAVFAGVKWTSPQPGHWEPQSTALPVKEAAHPVLGDLYRGRLGKGELLVFTKVDRNARPEAEPALLGLIKSLIPQQPFSAARGRFELTLRHDAQGRRYLLTALNGDLHASAEDEVHLRLPVRRAVDVEIGLELPLQRDGEERVLPLALAPGEGVVIELCE